MHGPKRIFLLGLILAAGLKAADDIEVLRQQLAEQRAMIVQLQKRVDEQTALLDRLAAAKPSPPAPAPQAAAAVPEAKSVNGFQFSGDLRLRLDAAVRSGNEFAPPLQKVRGAYRLRLNLDKQLDPRFRFHMQLASGPLNNPLTSNQEMAGLADKPPLSISEVYVDYRPNSKVSLRAGRTDEIFADSTRFLWDDDLRFNGFHQTVRFPLGANALGLTSFELRAAEYLLTNPGVYILPASSPYVAAGYQPGQKVRSSNLFHPGAVLRGSLEGNWTHQITGDVQLYRNPDQIQLASTANGFPVLLSSVIGLALSGPPSATGNATTTPGGAMYTAPDFHVSRLGYRLERRGVSIGGRELPAWLDFQVARNHGARSLRDAFMASVNLGAVRQGGDFRALYQFAIKDANSMISQFTDDNLGTGSGVNIAVHALRFDLGLTRFLQWQNLVFLQHQRRASNPSEQFFVPLGRGANATVRYLSHLVFTF